MEDEKIIRLYWDRNEQAIPATAEKYGNYCTAIARNILNSREDAEECVNDTYLSAWNAMPPHRPELLSVFLGRITRNLSFNRYKRNSAGKRGGGETAVVLEEAAVLVSDSADVEQEIDRRALLDAINAFLAALPRQQRRIFVCRYWYFDRIADIAKACSMRENHVSVILNRLRTKLRRYLLERGFEL